MMAKVTGICIVLVSAACAQRAAPSWPPPWLLIVPQGESRLHITLEVQGWPMAAVGDTMRLWLNDETCRQDSCIGHVRTSQPSAARWVSSDPQIASIDSLGLLRPLTPGRVRISVAWRDATLWRDFTILPRVATIRWLTHDRTLRVGDTVRLAAAAYDSAGRFVAGLPFVSGRHISGRSPGWPQADPRDSLSYIFEAAEVGEMRLFVRLAHRSDSLTIRVTPH